jgi:hypothetical protein
MTPAPTDEPKCVEKPECRARVERKRMRRMVAPFNAKLNRMAWCESRGNWFIATGNGFFGGLQFDLPTWQYVGGSGMPHQASKLEQKYRAVLLIKRRGFGPWPVCGSA